MSKRRKLVDASKVIEAVESGRLSKDVMDTYGLAKKMNEVGTRRRRRRDGDKPDDRKYGEITISKRGSLVLPAEMVEELGCKPDDAFIVRKTKSGMVLKPI